MENKIKNLSDFLGVESGIIFAADLPALSSLEEILKSIGKNNKLVALKVGFSLALRYGLPVIASKIRKFSNLPIIYDHQKAATDIPSMGKPFANICKDSGIESVILFPQAGPVTLRAFVEALFDNSLIPIVGTTMTHRSYLAAEGGYISNEAPNKIIEHSIELGVRNFVLPATKPNLISHYIDEYLQKIAPTSIIAPGIGSQGASIKSTSIATKGHHFFPVIGSAIYKSKDPEKALEFFTEEMEQ